MLNEFGLYSPMNKKNISKPNSRIDAFNVLPKICKPFECLDNLNIRNTRTKRITRSIAKDIAWFVDLSWKWILLEKKTNIIKGKNSINVKKTVVQRN